MCLPDRETLPEPVEAEEGLKVDRRKAILGAASQALTYAGLAPRVKQSGQSSRNGELSKAGSRTLRWAAVEAAQGAWRPSNPWHRLYSDVKARTGKANPAKAAHQL